MSHKEKTIALLTELEGKSRASGQHQIIQLFDLYNQVHKQKETGKHCGSCVARVLKKLRQYAVLHYNFITKHL